MPDEIVGCHVAAGDLAKKARHLVRLLLCGALLLAAASPASACGLDWANALVEWTAGAPGPFTFPMTGAGCPAGLTVTISITGPGAAVGSFATFSHREDCTTAPVNCPVNNFGLAHDLSVGFDPLGPATPPVSSPVDITATFSAPFPGLKFEISDVDFGGAPGTDPTGHRLDRVTVTSNVGNPVLTAKIAPPNTFTIAANVATAVCTGSEATNCTPAGDTADPNTDKGTVLVDFSALPAVTTVNVHYTEVGNQPDPAARGIGVFGNLTPVELMSFTVE